MAQNLFNKYVWLVNTLYRNKRMTLKEINNCWIHTDFSDGNPIPRRTFHNHREKIQEFFDINIECDRTTWEYYIEDSDSISNDKVRFWLLNSFAVDNIIVEQQKLHDRIILEKNPSGEIHLTTIIEAMRDNRILNFRYKPFYESEEHNVTLLPYFIRIFKQRWYIIGLNKEYNEIRIYALDRISTTEISKEEFVYPKEFTPENYFKGSFGIFVENKPIEKIILKVKSPQNNYIKTLPLHQSQKILFDCNNFTTFEYTLRPSFDFKQEILSQGKSVEVIQPQSLREDIINTLKETLKGYEE
ncbi:MAG: WYL domain-containing protein [Bacteroidales bacterium]|nr:WYL domain-containing protein [Bacteroidales bacterium]MBQ7819135.1 WYL domain-containing protein [Bacteroidales bacterium]